MEEPQHIIRLQWLSIVQHLHWHRPAKAEERLPLEKIGTTSAVASRPSALEEHSRRKMLKRVSWQVPPQHSAAWPSRSAAQQDDQQHSLLLWLSGRRAFEQALSPHQHWLCASRIVQHQQWPRPSASEEPQPAIWLQWLTSVDEHRRAEVTAGGAGAPRDKTNRLRTVWIQR